MNNKVNFLRGTATEYKSSIKDNDTFYYTTDTEKLYLGDKEITGGGVTIDDTLSDTSKNPVQNKVVKAALDEKLDTSLKGVTNGLAELDSSGKIPSAQLPTLLALGETSSTAYRGDRGKTAYDHSQSAHAPSNAEANVQSDWNITDTTSDAFIKNKPTSLPANGGNADTVDDKHAVDIMNMEFSFINRTSITEGDLDTYTTAGAYIVLQSIEESTLANQPPLYNTGYYLNVYRSNATLVTQIAMSWSGDIKIRSFIGSTWSGWFDIADNDKSYDNREKITTGDLNDYTSLGSYIVPTATTAAAVSNSPWNNTGYFLDVYYRTAGYCVQIAMTWGGLIKIRFCSGGTWYAWKSIADGGAAATANTAGTLATTSSNICLRNLSSGTADVTTTNCPAGTWYGIYE